MEISKNVFYLFITLIITSVLVTSCERGIIIKEDIVGFKTSIVEDELDGFKEISTDFANHTYYSLPNDVQHKTLPEIQGYLQNLTETEISKLKLNDSDVFENENSDIESRAKCYYVTCVHIGGKCKYANLIICNEQQIWYCSSLCEG